MTQSINSKTQPFDSALLVRQMLLGAGIALILITFFLFQVKDPKPEWGKLWMVRPLIIVPLAGAIGGVFYYFINRLRYQSSWQNGLIIILSLIVYVIVLWVGTVLGLDGTLWD